MGPNWTQAEDLSWALARRCSPVAACGGCEWCVGIRVLWSSHHTQCNVDIVGVDARIDPQKRLANLEERF